MTRKEFNQCVELYGDRLYRFILKNLRKEDLSRDIVQDTFESLWRNHEGISPEKARAWLFTTSYRLFIDLLRKEKQHFDLSVVREKQFVQPEEYKGTREILDSLLNKLPDDQKAVLLLRDYEGYNYKEIGEITGLSEVQVKVYIYRARSFMKDHLVKLENIV